MRPRLRILTVVAADVEDVEVGPVEVTSLLRAWRAGDQNALSQLMPLVYAELHRLADRQLRSERRGHSFRPTDLVSEAYLRFYAGQLPSCNDRSHFFALAARTMRQVLIDHARARLAAKRGGAEPRERIELDALGVDGRSLDLLALDEALRALAELDERKARIVELHYFSGLTQDEIAELLDLHVNTIARDLRLASAWLHRTLQ